MQVQDVLNWLDGYAPFRYAASWDNSGLLVGNPRAAVHKLLLALDVTQDTLALAKQLGCQCLLTHHPLIMQPLNAIRPDQFPGRLIALALTSNINIIAAHTNLDVARNGTNDTLARLLGLTQWEPLQSEMRWTAEETYSGLGCFGDLANSLAFQDFALQVQDIFPEVGIRVVGKFERPVQRIAVCSGSGGSLLPEVIGRSCDVFVTGDIKYHEACTALANNIALIDIGHFASERLILEPLAKYFQSMAAAQSEPLEAQVAHNEHDPFTILRPLTTA